MNEKEDDTPSGWVDPDEIPDLSTDEWAEVIEAAPVRYGRPGSVAEEVSISVPLDLEVVEAFKSGGAGWQGRINSALRKAAGLPERY